MTDDWVTMPFVDAVRSFERDHPTVRVVIESDPMGPEPARRPDFLVEYRNQVREALIERGLLLQRIAPHLVKPVKFLYPLNRPVFERLYIGAGMLLYDLFSYTGGRPPGVPHHRHLS